jgi:hypothetical protein
MSRAAASTSTGGEQAARAPSVKPSIRIPLAGGTTLVEPTQAETIRAIVARSATALATWLLLMKPFWYPSRIGIPGRERQRILA